MDAQAPNQLFREWAESRKVSALDPHCFDPKLSGEIPGLIFIGKGTALCPTGPLPGGLWKVKGCTLGGRGVGRVSARAHATWGSSIWRSSSGPGQRGIEAAVCFVIQMEGVSGFSPNDRTHPAFGAALRQAEQAGVDVLAYECAVTPEEVTLTRRVPVRL